MAENLNYYTSSFSAYWNNDSIEYSDYGRYYPQFVADTVCPSGYHLPTDSDWQTLESYIGMSDADTSLLGYRMTGDVGKHLKTDYLSSYWSGNGYGDDLYDFAAYPMGFRRSTSYYGLYHNAYFWSATESNTTNLYYYRGLYSIYDGIDRNIRSGSLYMNVRCLKD